MFPELSLTGYSLDRPERVALEPDSALIGELAEAAGEMAVVIGFVERGPQRPYSSAAYLEDGRVLHVQRKTFLPGYRRFDEDRHFSPGDGVRAFATRRAPVALLVCNDLWHAPLALIAVRDGAEVLVVPASSGCAADGDYRADWDELLRFHARFHQAFVVFVNRVGSEGEVRFWGGSRVVDPLGRVVAEAPEDDPALVIADLDLPAVERRRKELPVLKEARVELLAREFHRLADQER